MDELYRGLMQMLNLKCEDEHSLTAEMLKYGSEALHLKLLNIFNDLLHSGVFPADWHTTIFRMFPKSDDLQDPSNYQVFRVYEMRHCFHCSF